MSVACALLLSAGNSHKARVVTVISSMQKVLDTTERMAFTITKKEWFGDEYRTGEAEVDYNFKSKQININALAPRDDVELKYNPNNNRYKAHVTLDYMPNMGVELDIHGYMLMRDHHHPVSHVNGAYFLELLLYYMKHVTPHKDISIEKVPTPFGGHCWKMVILQHHNAVTMHTVQKSQRFADLVEAKKQNPYYCRELNNDEYDYDDMLSPGDELKLSTHYADKAEILLSDHFFFPISARFWIDDRLYEEYTYKEVRMW